MDLLATACLYFWYVVTNNGSITPITTISQCPGSDLLDDGKDELEHHDTAAQMNCLAIMHEA